MAKGTAVFISLLALIAVLLLGINLGKKIGFPQNTELSVSPPTAVRNDSPPKASFEETAVFTDETCGFSFSYPGSYMKQKTANQKSVIFVDPNNPAIAVAATCAAVIPKPPVASEQQESTSLVGEPAVLYHDFDPSGNPRDEIIVRHPKNGMEIIIAGYGEIFESVRASFRFIQ